MEDLAGQCLGRLLGQTDQRWTQRLRRGGPFGGFRESGLGRELGPEGLRNFLEPRSIGLPASLRSGAA